MSNIDPQANRTSFFPKSRNGTSGKTTRANQGTLPKRNNLEREKILKGKTALDAKVDINDAIKDFARIKMAVDNASVPDNSEKIALLREQINSGNYEIDYDALADEMIKREMY